MIILFGFLLLIGGLIAIFLPHIAWYLSVGWQFRDADPSDAALIWNRITGVIAALIGIILIISSVSTLVSGGNAGSWAKQFKQRVASGEVSNISIGFLPKKQLTDEELDEVIALIIDSDLIPYDKPNSYGYNSSGELEFNDGTKVDMIFFSPARGIELHPNGIDKGIIIESSTLENWFRSYLSD